MIETDGTVLMLAYFRQVYRERIETGPQGIYGVPLTDEDVRVEDLHLAYSHDGRRWTALNGNRPVCPGMASNYHIRDPFIGKAPDGRFHMLATGGGPRHLLHAASDDLIHWDGPVSVPMMEAVPDARNVWAPEWVIDPETGEYFTFWSSSFRPHGWEESRIWCARTRDFREFSEPRVLFDPGFTVIDATLIRNRGTWFMFLKDERFGHLHGERRHIRVATAPRLDGPYTLATEAVTPSITEGPAVFPAREPGRWYLVYDHCMDNCYGASVSDNLLHWERVPDAEFPPNARHGSVFTVTGEEWKALARHFAA